ncbi:MAG: amidohydrolase [Clostridia bacterium]|nr:amidohydrolase [Clostridia bacterium]
MRKIIDCHCHIYPEKIAAKAVESIGNFYDISMDMDGTYSNLVAAGNAAGITHYVIFSVATTPKQVGSINKFITDTVAAHNGFMTGLGTLHPDSPDQAADVEALIAMGLKGVKLHPDIQGVKMDDPRCIKMYELCRGRLPILFHTGDYRYDFSNPKRVKAVLEAFPDLTVIGAHFGGWSIWERATEELCRYDNFMVDCSSSLYSLDSSTARDLVRRYGADRVLFGTDYPMWEPKAELERFFAMGLTEEENELILHKNAEKLFGIE